VRTRSGASLASVAIRWSFVETVVGLDVPAIFPSTGLCSRCPLPSTGSPGAASPASTVLWSTPTSPGPSHVPRVRLRHGTYGGGFSSLHRVARPWPSCGLVRGRRWTHPECAVGDGRPPRFLGSPCVCVPRSTTPVGRLVLALVGRADAAFRLFHTVSPTRTVLSRLHHAAHIRAVYASQGGSPRHHARLASRLLARPCLGRTCTCWAPISNFKKVVCLSSFPFKPDFPGARKIYGKSRGRNHYFVATARATL